MIVIPIGGITLHARKTGWSESFRKKVGIPKENWREFIWSDLSDNKARKMSCAWWQKPFWWLFGDALGYRESKDRIIGRFHAMLKSLPDEAEILFVAHSWGTRVWYDGWMSYENVNSLKLQRVVLLGAALGSLAPTDLPNPPWGIWNIRGMGDFISLGLKKNSPHVREKWVLSILPHTGLWKVGLVKWAVRDVFTP
jgi:pimeloyl-ACP methyl ester carboxylesterase